MRLEFWKMTAAGNESQIAIAKKIMTGAVIGLVIILAAFGIAVFVMRVLLGATGGGGGGDGGTETDVGGAGEGRGQRHEVEDDGGGKGGSDLCPRQRQSS